MLSIGNRTCLYYTPGTQKVDYEKMRREGYTACDYSALTDTAGELYTLSEEEFIRRLSAEKGNRTVGGHFDPSGSCPMAR